ncbi:MAG: hypothetical protein RR554_10215 [Vagococcus sp.]|uniref:hypothetical protein n=1 Tax=Vagococcus sp. TaxID=1933889 RepID=UPI002FCB5DFF
MNHADMSVIKLIGVILTISGILLVGIGKKLPLVRFLLNDRSMLSQIFYGMILFIIGGIMLYFG